LCHHPGDEGGFQKDKITVNEKPIEIGEALVYIAVNKPHNVISAASQTSAHHQINRDTFRAI
jgi:16S rRNA U516 pseudouridylate synthase RsuA-like enzyme